MASTQLQIGPPEASEYAPYYGKYTALVTGGDVIRTLEQEATETIAILSSLTEEQGNQRYEKDKWSIKELLGHITDTERIFAYRALRIARNDKTNIEGFEQDDYVRNANFTRQRLADLIAEFKSVRKATLTLLRSLDEEAWTRRGTANKNEISVRALAYVIAGHELHHRKILKEKYLTAGAAR